MSVTVTRSDRFPIGTSVGAYPRAARKFGGKPSGSAVESHTVDAAGSLGPFTTLTANEPYVLYAETETGGHRYIDVEDSTFVEPPTGLLERIAVRRTAMGIES